MGPMSKADAMSSSGLVVNCVLCEEWKAQLAGFVSSSETAGLGAATILSLDPLDH